MRRLSNWTVAGIIAGLLVLIVGATTLMIRSEGNRAYAAMGERTRELIAEIRARPTTRPVLRGTAEPGNAWTDYEAAIAMAKSVGVDRQVLLAFIVRSKNADEAAAIKQVAMHQPSLDLLRRGVRRAEASFPYEWERGHAVVVPSLIGMQELGMLATAQARLLRNSGRLKESAELLLDLAQFAGDGRRNGVLVSDMIGIAVLSGVVDELRDLIASSPPDLLAQIDRELAQLDRDWPDVTISLRNEAAATHAVLVTGNFGDTGIDPRFYEAWRHGFSTKLMVADAGAWSLHTTEFAVRQESQPWLELVKAFDEHKSEHVKSSNPLLRALTGVSASASASVRHRRAQLRLLRMAVRFRLDGTTPDLADPFGDKLKWVRTETGLKAWSLGRDGLDQGGKGTWNGDVFGTDTVLEIQR